MNDGGSVPTDETIGVDGLITFGGKTDHGYWEF